MYLVVMYLVVMYLVVMYLVVILSSPLPRNLVFKQSTYPLGLMCL
jgi:hypothetical protein